MVRTSSTALTLAFVFIQFMGIIQLVSSLHNVTHSKGTYLYGIIKAMILNTGFQLGFMAGQLQLIFTHNMSANTRRSQTAIKICPMASYFPSNKNIMLASESAIPFGLEQIVHDYRCFIMTEPDQLWNIAQTWSDASFNATQALAIASKGQLSGSHNDRMLIVTV